MCTLRKKAKSAVFIIFVGFFVVMLTLSCSKKPEESEQTELTEQTEPSEQAEIPEQYNFDEMTEQSTDTIFEPAEQPNVPAAQPTAPVEPQEPVVAEEPAEPKTLYFKELDEIDDIEAEQLFAVAQPSQRIGQLPMTGYNLMVQTCRQIIQKWPDSLYAYKAKQLLIAMPDREKQNFSITEQETDIEMYEEPRTGTQPYTVQD